MRLANYSMLLFFLLILFLSSCTTTTKVDKLNSTYASKNENCEIEFFKDAKPEKKYETIGKIESHVQKDFFFGGKVKLEDEAYKELRIKTCGLGGDAVIIDDSIETSAAEMTHVHVWATVIKYCN